MNIFKKVRLPTKNFPDFCIVLGFIALNYGVFQIYKPAAFIVGGILLMIFGNPPKGRR